MNKLLLLSCAFASGIFFNGYARHENNNESLLKKRVSAREKYKKVLHDLALKEAFSQRQAQIIHDQEQQIQHLRDLRLFTLSFPKAVEKQATIQSDEEEEMKQANFINGNFEHLKRQYRVFTQQLFKPDQQLFNPKNSVFANPH
jgi:hypothetical protein